MHRPSADHCSLLTVALALPLPRARFLTLRLHCSTEGMTGLVNSSRVCSTFSPLPSPLPSPLLNLLTAAFTTLGLVLHEGPQDNPRQHEGRPHPGVYLARQQVRRPRALNFSAAVSSLQRACLRQRATAFRPPLPLRVRPSFVRMLTVQRAFLWAFLGAARCRPTRPRSSATSTSRTTACRSRPTPSSAGTAVAPQPTLSNLTTLLPSNAFLPPFSAFLLPSTAFSPDTCLVYGHHPLVCSARRHCVFTCLAMLFRGRLLVFTAFIRCLSLTVALLFTDFLR